MNAFLIVNGALESHEVPTPAPGPGEIAVRVRAFGVNPADILQRKGRYPAPPGWPADIPGLEYAGEVCALGPGLRGEWEPGDRVMGLVGGGAYAERVVVPEETVIPIPARFPFEEAAAIPEAFITAHDALVTQGGLQAGERVLVHAAAGGVGLAAVQIARAMGCEVFGTSRSPEKLDRLRAEFGLEDAIDSRATDFAAEVARLTGGAGVNLVIDSLGAGAWDANLRSLAMRGRMVMLGFQAGAEGALKLGPLLARRLTVRGTTLRSRPRHETIAAVAAFRAQVLPLLEDGTLRPVVDRVFAFAETPTAQARVESHAGFGRVVVAADARMPM